MYSGLALALAGAALAVLAWAFPVWRRERSALLSFNLAALAATCLYDLLGGLGAWFGPGDRLRDLYAFPILISIAAMPLTLFTFATLSRRLGFAWARIDWGHGAVCLAAAGLLLYELQGVFTMRLIYPACWRDIVWYLRSVPESLACPGTGAKSAVDASLPLALPLVLAAYTGLGAGLWRQRRAPWLLFAMVGGSALMLLPARWGPLPGFLGATICFSAMAVTAAHYAPVMSQAR